MSQAVYEAMYGAYSKNPDADLTDTVTYPMDQILNP
jgi:hypothetical protein